VNGPKRSGKTTLCDGLTNLFHRKHMSAVKIGFSFHLKRFVHSIYLGERGWHLDPDVFDATKELPQDFLDGHTWRELYIHYSEHVIKPLHGKEWFGKQFMRSARESKADFVFVPDSGFVEEAENVVRDIGAENVFLIRLRRRNKDGSWMGFGDDSRTYVDLSHVGVPMFSVVTLENERDSTAQAAYTAIKTRFSLR
jgi:hypothetical protein